MQLRVLLLMFRVKLVVLILLVQQPGAKANPFVVETDGVASSYAASLMYDDATDRLYITGSTYGGSRSFFHVDGIQDAQQRLANEFVVEQPLEVVDDEEKEAPLSDCFIGILQVPRGDRAPEWLRRVAIGEPDQSESCSDLFTYRQGNSRKLLLVGHVIGGGSSVLKEQQAYFSSSSSSSSSSAGSNATVSGLVLDLTWYAEVLGGYLMDEKAVQYPVAVVADERQTTDEDIYVATLRSSWSEINPAFQLYQENEVDEHIEELDLTTSGGYLPPAFGNKFSLSLQRLGRRSSTESEILTIASEKAVDQTTSNEIPNSATLLAIKAAAGIVDTSSLQAQSYDQYRYVAEPLAERWRREFDGDETSIQVSGLLHLKRSSSNIIIVAGSTRGSVAGLGKAEDNSMTGFIAAIDSSLGITLQTRRLSSSATTSDHILGICQDANRNLYAVGMTNGGVSKGQLFVGTESQTTFAAFLQKLNPDTLNAIWTKSLAAATDAARPGSIHGMSCAVTPDGSYVYLAGTVKAGAAITLDGKTLATTSAGHDDIFVAQYKSSDGTLNFVRQIGTKENDQLAAGNGAVCDKYGNLIVIANTQGSFVNPDGKKNPYVNDVVVLSVDRISGDHAGFTPTTTTPAASSDSPHESARSFVSNLQQLQQKTLGVLSKDGHLIVLVGIFAFSAVIALATMLVLLCRKRRNGHVSHFRQFYRIDFTKAQAQKGIEDIDPECANSSEENSASTGDSSSYDFHENSRAFCDEDALMPLSTPADEAGNIGYKASLRRLEQVQRQVSPLKRHRSKAPFPALPKIEKTEDTQSLLQNQGSK